MENQRSVIVVGGGACSELLRKWGCCTTPRARGRPSHSPPFEASKRRGFGVSPSGCGRQPARVATRHSSLSSPDQYSSACWVGRARADEGFEAPAGFVLGGEIAGSGEGFGTVLGGEEALQSERLLDAQAGELVASLGDLEGARRREDAAQV